MNKDKIWFEAQARNFTKTANGVRWEAVIFSSEFNRNKRYFDIKKLFKPFQTRVDLLNKILLNNSHDGRYFSVATDKVVEVVINESDDGQVTEVYAIVESTNEEKKANPEMVTGFSIEIMVDANDVAVFPDGDEFYRKPEWMGLAYLEGQLAGSGDTRILSMKTFAAATGEQPTTKNNMNFNLLSEITNEQIETKVGDIVLDKASDLPAIIFAISPAAEATTVCVELLDGKRATYLIADNAEEIPVASLGAFGALKVLLAKWESAPVDAPEDEDEDSDEDTDDDSANGETTDDANDEANAEGFSKELDDNLAVFKDLEKEDRENKMKIFNQLKGTEELAEGNEAPATDTVGLSLRERVIDKIKNIQI